MGLEAIGGVGPATVRKLNKAGIRTLDDVRNMDPAAIAARSGLATARLAAWQAEARSMRVIDDLPGIGPAMRKRLAAAGVRDPTKLARADAGALAAKLGVHPDRVRTWQQAAGASAAAPTGGQVAGGRKQAPSTARKGGPRLAPSAVSEAPGPEVATPVEAPEGPAPPPMDGIAQSQGFFRRVMTFLTGGPMR